MEKTTNVFTVLDEDKMIIAEQTVALNNGFSKHVLPAIFETEKAADEWASSRLEMWTVVKSHFNHKWIEHRQNTQPELVSCEMGKSIDTESNHIIVRIRFAKWTMQFDWTINLKSNWVHTNQAPTHIANGSDDDNEIENFINDKNQWETCEFGKDAQVIMEHFDFETHVDLFGEAIEKRMIPIS
jgi:hypothetical protein